MKRAVFVLTLILSAVFVLCLTACESEGAVVAVEFADENLKTVYAIDESFDLDEIKLNIICEKKTKTAVVTGDKIVGFDTRTCGEKTLTVEYEGFNAEWNYTVEYTKEGNRTVNTAARVSLLQEEYPTGLRRAVGIDKGDLNKISAITFTVNADKDFADKYFTRFEVEQSPYFDCRLFYLNAKTVRVLVFATADTDADAICKFILLGVGDCTVKLTEISVSDGRNDYLLPETGEV